MFGLFSISLQIGVFASSDPVPLVPGMMTYGFVYTNDYERYNISWTP